MSILKRIPPGHLGFDGVNVYEPGWHFLAGPVRLFATEPEEKTLDFVVPLPDGSAVVVGAKKNYERKADTLDDEDERQATHAFVDNFAEKERRRLLGLWP